MSITGYDVMKFLENATMEQMSNFMIGASDRLYKLSHEFSGMKEANLREAAGFAIDASKDIRGAIEIEDAQCNCYKCDDCQAARSDEHHDRKQDGLLTKGEK